MQITFCSVFQTIIFYVLCIFHIATQNDVDSPVFESQQGQKFFFLSEL